VLLLLLLADAAAAFNYFIFALAAAALRAAVALTRSTLINDPQEPSLNQPLGVNNGGFN
jgi:hypothetical protein